MYQNGTYNNVSCYFLHSLPTTPGDNAHCVQDITTYSLISNKVGVENFKFLHYLYNSTMKLNTGEITYTKCQNIVLAVKTKTTKKDIDCNDVDNNGWAMITAIATTTTTTTAAAKTTAYGQTHRRTDTCTVLSSIRTTYGRWCSTRGFITQRPLRVVTTAPAPVITTYCLATEQTLHTDRLTNNDESVSLWQLLHLWR